MTDTAPGVNPSVPAWRRLAERLRTEALGADAAAAGAPDPADFDLDEDCCLGGCCAKGTAYLEALDAAAARRDAAGRG